jgi:hypothetical protein
MYARTSGSKVNAETFDPVSEVPIIPTNKSIGGESKGRQRELATLCESDNFLGRLQKEPRTKDRPASWGTHAAPTPNRNGAYSADAY